MTKEIIEKISNPNTPLVISDMAVEEKKSLGDFLLTKGLTSSTFYLRFFQKGFELWEILGIKRCKEQFLAISDIAKLLLSYVEVDVLGNEIGNKGYLYTLAKSDDPGIFYACLKKANNGLCIKFFEFMEEKGMSRNTVIKRFSADDWKPWEQDGIAYLLQTFFGEADKK